MLAQYRDEHRDVSQWLHFSCWHALQSYRVRYGGRGDSTGQTAADTYRSEERAIQHCAPAHQPETPRALFWFSASHGLNQQHRVLWVLVSRLWLAVWWFIQQGGLNSTRCVRWSISTFRCRSTSRECFSRFRDSPASHLSGHRQRYRQSRSVLTCQFGFRKLFYRYARLRYCALTVELPWPALVAELRCAYTSSILYAVNHSFLWRNEWMNESICPRPH